MNFLNPVLLWALPAAAIPVILHLLNKRPPKRVEFSHVGWLKNVHQTLMPKKKLQELILMLIRTLIALCLVLFFARPIFHRNGMLVGASSDESIVFLVDVSASMGAVEAGREALDWTKERLTDALRQIPLGVKIGLVLYSDRVEQELAPTDERSRLMNALQNAKTTQRGTDVVPALMLGAKMLSNQPKGRKTLVAASDNAQHGWLAAMKAGKRIEALDPDVRVVLWDAVGKVANVGVSDGSLELSEEGLLKGQVRFHRSGPATSSPTWALHLNDRVVSQGTVADAGESIAMKAQLPEGGFYSGRIELTPDAALFDNSYYLAGRVPKGFRLLVVDGESGLAPSDAETYYLRSALESPRDPRVESIETIRPEALSKQSFDHYDAIVLANVGDGIMDAAKEMELVAWVEQGGGLLISAGAKWPKPPHVPFRFFRAAKWSDERQFVLAPDVSAPFLSGVSGISNFQWDQVSVSKYVVLEKESVATVLLALKNGDPLLLRKQLGKGYVLCLTTSLDRSWTNFPAKPVFAPLMRELLAALADPLREQTALQGFVGTPIRLRVPAGVRSVSVIAPDGVAAGAHVTKDGVMEWPAPSLAGLYQVKTDRHETDFAFAVNIPRLDLEGDLTRFSERDAKKIFPDNPVDYVDAGTNKAEALVAALQGHDLANPILACLFVLFGLETFFGWKRKES